MNKLMSSAVAAVFSLGAIHCTASPVDEEGYLKKTAASHATAGSDPSGTSISYAEPGASGLEVEDIEFRPGVTADIHVRLFENPHVPCEAGTIVALHGMSTTGASFAPLAQTLFEVDRNHPVCRLAAVDMPGHGLSPLPTGVLFGELVLSDYANIVIKLLERLPDYGVHPKTIMGASLGGIVTQLVQQELLHRGESLAQAFHIRHAILFAPTPPPAVPWVLRDQQAQLTLDSPGIFFDPARGYYLESIPLVWVYSAFSNLSGMLVSTAPTPQEVVAAGYVAPEPLGVLATCQPNIDPGIFAPQNGTQLDVVGFEQDTLVAASNAEAAYGYLSGEPASEGFTLVAGPEACHGDFIGDPYGMLDQVESRVDFP